MARRVKRPVGGGAPSCGRGGKKVRDTLYMRFAFLPLTISCVLYFFPGLFCQSRATPLIDPSDFQRIIPCRMEKRRSKTFFGGAWALAVSRLASPGSFWPPLRVSGTFSWLPWVPLSPPALAPPTAVLWAPLRGLLPPVPFGRRCAATLLNSDVASLNHRWLQCSSRLVNTANREAWAGDGGNSSTRLRNLWKAAAIWSSVAS